MLRDDATILDILRAARLAQEFRQTTDKQTFFADMKTQSAVLHQLLVIGEAAGRLSNEFCRAHSELPIADMVGMRNVLIHEYDDVQLDEVWSTVDEEVPDLIKTLETVAKERQN